LLTPLIAHYLTNTLQVGQALLLRNQLAAEPAGLADSS
jgi:hypothetical protein